MGDRNTNFFHQPTLARRSRNKICALRNFDGIWVYDEEELQGLVMNFFKDLYTSQNGLRPSFCTSYSFPPISEADRNMLSMEVSFDEVKKALFSMKNFKSPRPYGYHPAFFKSQWEIIGPSIYKFVQDCFAMPSIIR